MAANEITSEIQRKKKLTWLIEMEDTGPDLITCLFSNGRALDTESPLWDFKRKYPDWSRYKSKEASEKSACKAEISELVKDCVAFHNSFGGFIVFGIDDNTRLPCGTSRRI